MWCPIVYFEFYDVPRLFVVTWRGRVVIFDGLFDDALDDYPPRYSVYCSTGVPQDWSDLGWINQQLASGSPCGEVPVGSVLFDESCRRAINDNVLWRLFAE